MNNYLLIDVMYKGDKLKTIVRFPILHKGWESIRYNGRRYQLHGGVRVSHRIYLENPIPKRGERLPGSQRVN